MECVCHLVPIQAPATCLNHSKLSKGLLHLRLLLFFIIRGSVDGSILKNGCLKMDPPNEKKMCSNSVSLLNHPPKRGSQPPKRGRPRGPKPARAVAPRGSLIRSSRSLAPWSMESSASAKSRSSDRFDLNKKIYTYIIYKLTPKKKTGGGGGGGEKNRGKASYITQIHGKNRGKA